MGLSVAKSGDSVAHLGLLAIPVAAVVVVLLLADYGSDAVNRNVRRIRLTVVAVLVVLVVVVLIAFATEGVPFS